MTAQEIHPHTDNASPDFAAMALIAEPTAVSSAQRDYHRMPARAVSDVCSVWWVAHTKPRQEKALADALVALGISCFLPAVTKVRYYEHRKRSVELPLFPSYVFLQGDGEARLAAFHTNRVAQILAVPDQTRLEHELRQIDLALAGGAILDPYPYLTIGRRVAVSRGPFMGMEGIVDDRRSPDRLVLVVSMLGRATSVEIDASLLEPLD